MNSKLAAVEAIYHGHGLPARYQITPTSHPDGLRELLLARGYKLDAPTAVQCCDLESLGRLTVSHGPAVTVDSRPTAVWWATWRASLGLDTDRLTAVADAFARVEGETAFAVVCIDGSAAAVAMGVLEDRWLGIFNMATLPEQRGRGAGRAVLSALAGWAQRRNAATGYLQVELDNQPAMHLYAGVGFADAYRYGYLSTDGASPITIDESRSSCVE